MRLKRALAAGSALALVLATGACDNGLTEINENPNAPVAVPAQYVLADAIMDGVGAAYGSHGEWFGLYLTNLWSQQIAQPIYNDEDRYVPRDAQLNGIWTTFYTQPLEDLVLVKQIADSTSQGNLGAVAEILTQWGFMHLTDTYGDVPYSQALQGVGALTPAYDAQADIYAGMQAKLAAASQAINPAKSVSFADGDLVYGGDMGKWQKFANSLRMRLALHTVNAQPEQAQQLFVEAYNAGPFTSNADNAMVQWPGTASSWNPIFDHFYSRPLNDFMVSDAMVSRLQATDDPRLSLYADPTVASADSAGPIYRGLPNGSVPGNFDLDMKNFSHIGEYFRQATSPSLLMSYAEVLFMEAEAAERGWIAGDPAALYKQGIEAAMQMYDIPQAKIDAYLAQPEVAYDGLQSIWTQEWIALYLNGPEAWTLVRRTGWPQLIPAVGDQIPLRLPYPTDEQLYNKDNTAQVSMFDPIWWEAK